MDKKRELSAFIIRPEALTQAVEIISVIHGRGLFVEAHTLAMIQESDLQLIYPDVTGPIWDRIKQHMLNRYCHVGYVSGEKAISRLLEIVGTETNPRECEPNSLRYRFASHIPPENLGGGLWYYLNAIHRSRDAEEAARDVVIARRYELLASLNRS